MIRKLVIATAAIAALSAGSLTMSTTAAEAKKGGGMKGHHGHHGHFHRHLRFGAGYAYFDGCLKRVWVINRFGESVLRTVNLCD